MNDTPIANQIAGRVDGPDIQYAKFDKEQRGIIPLQLDSLEQRIDMLRQDLYKLYEKLGPVLAEENGGPGRAVADVASMNVSSAVAGRIAMLDDQVMALIDGARFVTDRVQL